MKKTQTAVVGAEKKRSLFLAVVTDIFVLLLLTGQILVYDDFYFNMLETKYAFFWKCTVSMLALFALYGHVRLILGKKRELKKMFSGAQGLLAQWVWLPLALILPEILYIRDIPKNLTDWVKRKGYKGTFSAVDVMVILFAVFVVLSTILSPLRYEAFWGNKGRYTGAFFLLLCVAIYFCVSRCYRVRWWHLELFLIVGMMMCLFGISDYFGMDVLHFKENIKETQRNVFTSFIGNINTYTACVAMVMGMAGVLFASCKNLFGNIWYGICITISFAAIITGQSDNAYLALIGFFGFLPLYLFRSRQGFRKYFFLIALFFSTIQWVTWTQTEYEGTVIRLTGLFKTLIGFEGIEQLTKYLWMLTAFLYAMELVIFIWKKWGRALLERCMGRTPGKRPETGLSARRPAWFARAWWLVIIAAAFYIAYVVYDATFAGNAEKYGVFAQYVKFQDSWGTHRGYIWRIAAEDYMRFPLLQKIFGYGPDTFGLLTWYNNIEMVNLFDERFDSVHNEFLQFLITIGPFGLLSYLGILVTSAWHAAKRHLENPYIIGAVFAVVCYSFQAVVNINQPIATPIMWLLLCISVAEPAALPHFGLPAKLKAIIAGKSGGGGKGAAAGKDSGGGKSAAVGKSSGGGKSAAAGKDSGPGADAAAAGKSGGGGKSAAAGKDSGPGADAAAAGKSGGGGKDSGGRKGADAGKGAAAGKGSGAGKGAAPGNQAETGKKPRKM